MEEKQVKYDVDGYEVVTDALRTLLNQFPGLYEGENITFSVLGEDSGIAIFPVSGAVVESSTTNIIGQTTEVCLYPFYIVYRVPSITANQKAKTKEWLDNLGKWLERKKVLIDGEECQLEGYPPLTEGREFLSIDRQTPGYLDSVEENNSENWTIYITARYQSKS